MGKPQVAKGVNRDFLKNTLGLKTDNTVSTYFENDTYVVISPEVQSARKTFDIHKNTLDRALSSNKKIKLIVRYYQSFLLYEMDMLRETILRDETLKVYVSGPQNGMKKWAMQVVEEDEANCSIYVSGHKEKVKTNRLNRKDLEENFLKEKRGNMEKLLAEINLSPSNLITHIHTYISSKGFNYTLENIKNLYLSLRAKPFVIISGISGTGKTKIVQLFAESIGATEDNGQFRLVPVRPDWSDSSDLIGYEKLSGEYVDGHLTKMIKQANENQNRPHFLLLDEMNLARVEYYFSDVLSVMESRSFEDGELTSSTINPDREQEERVTLPGNLYVIGTVNMDETTHPFSKKVLDRANTIEFNEIDLMNLPNTSLNVVEPIVIGNEALQSKYIHLIDLMNPQTEQLVTDVASLLVRVNAILTPIHTQVGYRVRDEICFYMAYNAEDGLLTTDEALDFCIMQKILPRITGAGNRLDTALKALQTLLGSMYPRSEKKIAEMIGRLGEDGFTSFWIA